MPKRAEIKRILHNTIKTQRSVDELVSMVKIIPEIRFPDINQTQNFDCRGKGPLNLSILPASLLGFIKQAL